MVCVYASVCVRVCTQVCVCVCVCASVHVNKSIYLLYTSVCVILGAFFGF